MYEWNQLLSIFTLLICIFDKTGVANTRTAPFAIVDTPVGNGTEVNNMI